MNPYGEASRCCVEGARHLCVLESHVPSETNVRIELSEHGGTLSTTVSFCPWCGHEFKAELPPDNVLMRLEASCNLDRDSIRRAIWIMRHAVSLNSADALARQFNNGRETASAMDRIVELDREELAQLADTLCVEPIVIPRQDAPQ